MKYPFLLIMVSFLVLAFHLPANAATKSSAQAEVEQQVNLDDNGDAELIYEIQVVNNSDENYISEINLELPYKNVQIIYTNVNGQYVFQNNNFKVSLLADPLPPGRIRDIVVKISAKGLISKFGNFRQFYLKGFGSSLDIERYELSIKYPQSWGALDFSNYGVKEKVDNTVTFDRTANYYLVWGGDSDLELEYTFTSEKNNLIPLFYYSQGQSILSYKVQPSGKLYFDEDGNAYILYDQEGTKTLSSHLLINTTEEQPEFHGGTNNNEYHFPELGNVPTQNKKIKALADYLKQHYVFAERTNVDKSIEKMSGDKFNLSILALLWMQQQGVESYLAAGWDLSLLDFDNEYDYWIYWKDGDGEWQVLDLNSYTKGAIDQVDNTVPEIITLLTLKNTDMDNVSRFEKFLSNNFRPAITESNDFSKINTKDKSDTSFHIVWEHDTDFNIIRGKLNVVNDTDKLLKLNKIIVNDSAIDIADTPKGYTNGVLPNSYKTFEIKYSRDFNSVLSGKELLNVSIDYTLGATSYKAEQSDDINVNVLVGNDTAIFILGVAAISFLGIQIFKVVKSPFYLDRLKSLMYNANKKVFK